MQNEEVLRLPTIMARQMDGATFTGLNGSFAIGRIKAINYYEYQCQLISRIDGSLFGEITGPDTTVLRVTEVR
jgi:hypothetical protein